MKGKLDAEIVWIPIDDADVPALEQMLMTADPFVTTMMGTDNPYRLADYVWNAMHGPHEVRVLLDRNIVSRAVRLASGHETLHDRPDSETDRVAAACMAFLITAGLTIEPNIALYELASADPATARQETQRWRVADHVHPQAYLDVALRREERVHPLVIREARRVVAKAGERAPNLESQLRYFRHHLCTVSKIALLDRTNLTPLEKMHELIDWSVHTAFFNGIATSFAIILFSGRRAGRMVKNVRSMSADRCIEGIRNAAWDLTYLSTWVNYAKSPSPQIWVFCTGDRLLKRVARASVVADEHCGEDLFRECWPRKEATALIRHYREALASAEAAPDRGEKVRARIEQLDAITTGIQASIKRAAPSCNGREYHPERPRVEDAGVRE